MSYDRHKIYYVYALLDPSKPGPFRYGRWKFSHEPFYVGKGKNHRIHVHCKVKNLKGTSGKVKRIKSILASGLMPIEVIKKQALTEKQALTLEAFLIGKILRVESGGPLLNETAGWNGLSPSPQVRKKIGRNSKRMHSNFSEAQKSSRKSKIGSGQAAYWERLRSDPKAYAERCKKVFKLNTLPADELTKIRKRMSKGRTLFWANATEEQLANISNVLSKAGKESWARRKSHS